MERLILAGKLNEARREISRFAANPINREQRLSLARLARKAAYPALSVRLLNPVVYPKARQVDSANAEEKAEYAVALLRLGAVSEATELLRKLPPKSVPEAPLYFAYALFTQWNYRDAIPLLETFLETSGLSEQDRVIGKLNLTACYVHEHQPSHARPLLQELERQTRRQEWRRFLGNTLELQAQLAILDRHWGTASGALRKARELLKNTESLDSLFVDKWEAIMGLLRSPRSRQALSRVHQLREKASQVRHYETLRDCDAWSAIARGDEALLHHVYFGTPYPSYRKTLLTRFHQKYSLPDFYDWTVEGSDSDGPLIEPLDAAEGRILKYWVILTSDFYRPHHLAGLFSKLYPGEYYHPQSSPTRLHQSLKYFRQWLRDHRIALSLKETDGNYWLRPEGRGCSIRVPRLVVEDTEFAPYLPLFQETSGKAFTADFAALRLNLPRRTVFRKLQAALKEGLLIKQGSGPSTKYRFSR